MDDAHHNFVNSNYRLIDTEESAPTRPSRERGYTLTMRAMHWATVILLLGAYLLAWQFEHAATEAEAARLLMLHRSAGVSLLLLTGIRFAWRQRTRIPPLPADVPALQQLAARMTAYTLYLLLAAQPLLGLFGSMLRGDRIVIFGGMVVPAFFAENRPLARQIFDLHGWTALLFLAVIGMHVSAALYHHFVRRDDVLSGMLPRLPMSSGSNDFEPEKAPS